jgi:hypothetical protein
MKKYILILCVLTIKHTVAQLCFDPATTYSICAGTPETSVVSKDLNNDGKSDLIVTSCNNAYILLGTGTGSFNLLQNYSVGFNPWNISVEDYNNDGNLDIAVANYNPPGITVILGNGNGSFNSPTTFFVIAAAPNANSICSSDYNEDGNMDLVVTNSNSGNLAILFGDGLGNFGLPNYFPTSLYPSGVTTADFNSDGNMDLATCHFNDSLSIILGNGGGNFTVINKYKVVGLHHMLINDDINSDGIKDLITNNYNLNSVSVLLGIGNGAFNTPLFYAVGTNPTNVQCNDIDGDGNKDLVVTNSSGNISILLGNGMGTFSSISYTIGSQPSSSTSGDFNSDGKTDIAVANYSSPDLSVFLSCSPTNIIKTSSVNEVGLYPNPSNGQITIDALITETQTIQIFDINGVVVFNQNISGKKVLNLEKLNEGVYSIMISSNQTTSFKKLVIVK